MCPLGARSPSLSPLQECTNYCGNRVGLPPNVAFGPWHGPRGLRLLERSLTSTRLGPGSSAPRCAGSGHVSLLKLKIMAALLLSFAGDSLGEAFGPAGAITGRAIGALAGGVIDRALFGDSTRRRIEGPRLADLDVMARPRARRFGGSMDARDLPGIWAIRLEEVCTRSERAHGGKGSSGPCPTTTTPHMRVSPLNSATKCGKSPTNLRRAWKSTNG